MAISLGTGYNSGNKASATSATFSTTVASGVKTLVVVVTGYDSSATDSVVNSVVFNTSESFTQIAGGRYRVGSDFQDIWYLKSPTATTANVVVTMAGTCTDVQATAIGLIDNSARTIEYDSFDTGTGTGSASAVVSPARSGSYAIGGGVAVGGTPASLSITPGAEISGSEVDMGSQTASCGTVASSGGSATITWNYAAVVCTALAATFYSKDSYADNSAKANIKVTNVPGVYTNGYSYRRKITIDNTKVSGSSNFTDFPVLFDTTSTDISSKVQNASGWDIRFELADGTKLDHELEYYDSATGRIVAWVEIPTLYGSSDTEYYIYYGKAGLGASEENITGTWNSNIKGVWHMKENPGGSAPQLIDSTSGDSDMTTGGSMTSGQSVDFGVYKGVDFDGAGDYASHTDDASDQLRLNGNTTLTMRCWLNMDAITADEHFVMGKYTYSLNTGYTFNIRGLTNSGKITAKVNGSSRNATTTASYISAGSAYLIHVVWTGGNSFRFFTNGTFREAVSISAATLAYSTSPFVVACAADAIPNYGFNGKQDEVRVYTNAASDDWVATEYNTESDPSTFYSLGGEESGATWWVKGNIPGIIANSVKGYISGVSPAVDNSAKANIKVTSTKDVSAEANIRVTNINAVSSKGSVRVTNSNGQSAKASIVVSTPNSISSKANIKVTSTNGISAKANVVVTNTANNSTKADIFVVTSSVVSAKANIKVQNTDNVSAKASIVRTESNAQSAKASIVVSTTKNISSLANIRVTSAKDTSSKADILVRGNTYNNSAKGSIILIYTKDTSAKADIFVVSSNVNNTKANIIWKNIAKDNSAQGSVVIRYTKDNSVLARVDTRKRYWIGGTGEWDTVTTTHWSYISGGSGGAPVPTQYDDVYFDSNSFTGDGQTLTLAVDIDVGHGELNAKTVDFTGVTHSPTVYIPGSGGGYNVNIYGSLILDSSLTFTSVNSFWRISMKGYGTYSIDTKGVSLEGVVFYLYNGTFNLASDLDTVSIAKPVGGIYGYSNANLNTNGYTLNAEVISYMGNAVTLGNSTINMIGDAYGYCDINMEATSLDAGTSHIIFDNPTSGDMYFNANHTFYDVQFNGTGYVYYSGNNTFTSLSFQDDIYGYINAGNTITVNNFTVVGTPANHTSLAANPSSPWYIVSNGTINVSYANLSYSHASGGAYFLAKNSNDYGDNSGWWFEKLNTNSAKAYLFWIVANNQSVKADIFVANNRIDQSVRAYIFNGTTRDNSAKASIVVRNIANQSALASIVVTTTKVNSVKADVFVITSVGQSVKADVLVRNNTYAQSSIASIVVSNPKGVSVKANVVVTNAKDSSAKANIKTPWTKDVSVKADIKATSVYGISVLGNIASAGTYGQSVKAQIVVYKTADQSVRARIYVSGATYPTFVLANIKNTYTNGESAKASIVVTETKTQYSIANIVFTETREVSVKADIWNFYTYSQLTKASIGRAMGYDQSAKASIVVTEEKGISVKADIFNVYAWNNFVQANVSPKMANWAVASIVVSNTGGQSVRANIKARLWNIAKANIISGVAPRKRKLGLFGKRLKLGYKVSKQIYTKI